MSDETPSTATVHGRIGDIPAVDWDLCANPPETAYNPFVSHAFLAALEAAGTTGRGSGWNPHHVVLRSPAGAIEAVMPLYAKTNSQGEYVFDHAWAEAYHRAGGRYYPKLQVSVPFTPVPGPRLLTAPGADQTGCEHKLVSAALTLAERLEASSLHITFATEAEWQRLGELGLLQRTGQQFHWHNRGYRDFGDFLDTLASRKRKAIRNERAAATAVGVSIETVTGQAITEAHWDAMYEFYIDTGSRKWGRPYLNRAFFSELGASMADRCLLVFAVQAGQRIAGALHLIGGGCLYGRYWGTTQYVPCLHFELCYYQAIDYAIANGLARIEAGAQGDHKLARGYVPVTTYSAHWLADPRLAAGVERFLTEERRAVEHSNRVLETFAPYKQAVAEEQD